MSRTSWAKNSGFALSALLAVILNVALQPWLGSSIVTITPTVLALRMSISYVHRTVNRFCGRPDWTGAQLILSDFISPALGPILFRREFFPQTYERVFPTPEPTESVGCGYVWAHLCYELARLDPTQQLLRSAYCQQVYKHSMHLARRHTLQKHRELAGQMTEMQLAIICLEFEIDMGEQAGQCYRKLQGEFARYLYAYGRCARGFHSADGTKWTDLRPVLAERHALVKPVPTNVLAFKLVDTWNQTRDVETLRYLASL